jgi:hypothetical protein
MVTIEKIRPGTFIFLGFPIPIAEECRKTLQKQSMLKG